MAGSLGRFGAPARVASVALATALVTAATSPAAADSTFVEGAPAGRRKGDVARELFEVELAFELGGRRFTYTDPVSTNIRDYQVFGAPIPVLEVAFYPGADGSNGFLRDLGVFAGASHAFGLDSKTNDGTSVGTSYDRFHAGLRERLHPGLAGVVVGLSGAFALTRFAFDAQGALAGEVPSVSYAALRGAFDLRVPLAPFSLLLAFGYDGPLASGDVHARFRDASVGGVDTSIGLSLALSERLEGRLSASYSRYFYTFHPVPGDVYVAGGALDELLGVRIGVAYAY